MSYVDPEEQTRQLVRAEIRAELLQQQLDARQAQPAQQQEPEDDPAGSSEAEQPTYYVKGVGDVTGAEVAELLDELSQARMADFNQAVNDGLDLDGLLRVADHVQETERAGRPPADLDENLQSADRLSGQPRAGDA